jgi:peptidoglycan/xylan/chitin deacetylase (PgdA/CDA1 family)
VLGYHGIWLGQEGYPGDAMFMAAQTFARHLEIIQRTGDPVLPLEDVTRALREERPLPHRSTVITIDDGWYSTYSAMLPLLRARSLPATLYVNTQQLLEEAPVVHVMARYLMILARRGYAGTFPREADGIEDLYRQILEGRGEPINAQLARVERLAQILGISLGAYFQGRVFHYMTPAQLAEAHGAGLDVQLHSHEHTLHDFTSEAVRQEIMANRHHLSRILKVPSEAFRHFCYPGGQTRPGVGPVLESLGILGSTTTRADLAYGGGDCQYLPRILDGENVSDIELEAELSGTASLLRVVASRGLWRRDTIE